MFKRIRKAIQRFIIQTVVDDLKANGPSRILLRADGSGRLPNCSLKIDVRGNIEASNASITGT